MIVCRGCHTVLFLLTAILINVNTEELTFKQTLKKENSIFKELHQILMPYFWILFSNALIYIVGFRHKQNFYLYHGILFSLIIIFTIATSFPVLLQQGLFRRPFHYILGVILWCLMIAQLILGSFQMLIKRGYLQNILSLDLYDIGRFHKLIGITIYICTKISIIQRFKKHAQNLIAFIIWQICFLIFLYWRRSNSNINDLKMIVQSITSTQKVNNLKQLNLSNKIVGLYVNYIFDIKKLEQIHPGGKQMIRQIHLKSFDKYIYGIQSLYKLQSNYPHEHSKYCFSLLKQPIAILDIKSPYNFGFQETISKVKASSILKLSQNLFEIRLKKVEGFQFEYSGYCSLNQFGRFYTIQDENKLCRLYTAVNFLTYKNTEYLKNHKFYKFNDDFQENANNQMENIDTIALHRNQELSLLIKRYENGRFTSNLQQYKDKIFNISKQCGEGLGLDNVQPGHIIVFVGGTGIFPFCDLIDMLYQNYILQQQKSKSKQYLANKILIEKPLNTFSFEFYGSFKKIQDIHYITANQIAYLSKNSNKFSFLYNLDIHPTTECMNALNIRLTQEKFQNIVARDNFKSQFSKIYVCGPYKLSKKLYKSLSSKFSSEKYQIL